MLIFAAMTHTPALPLALPAPNPLLERSDLPHGLPRFERYTPALMEDAYHTLMQREKRAYADIAQRPASFENTILGLEQADADHGLAQSTFWHLWSVCNTTELSDIKERLMPVLTAHGIELKQNPALFDRVKTVYEARDQLPPDAQRLVKSYYDGMVASGAGLPADQQMAFKNLNAELSSLTDKFDRNLLEEGKAKTIFLRDEADLAGLPPSLVSAYKEAATQLNQPEAWAITMDGEAVREFQKFSTRRDLRERVWQTYSDMGNGGDQYDNNELIVQIVAKRQQIAQMLGYPHYAAMATEDNMAKSPANALNMLTALVPAASAAYAGEFQAVQEFARGLNDHPLSDKLERWDWLYYSRRHEEVSLGVTDEELKPYLELSTVRGAFFKVCKELFGIDFKKTDLPGHHKDATVWEVTKADGSHVGLFMTDDFARSGAKQDGAWMNELRGQNGITGQRPIIFNVMNYPPQKAGDPVLLTLDQAVTLFHEGGHALHGLLSNTRFPSQAGTRVVTDIVELPSQLMERFFTHPELMKAHLAHHVTGEAMPDDMIEKVQKRLAYGMGYTVLRQLSFGIPDLELYQIPDGKFNPQTFEQETLDRHGFPKDFRPKPMLQSFQHIMSGGYAAGYYSYMWADMPVADVAEAFNQNPLDRAKGDLLVEAFYGSGSSRDAADNFKVFSGGRAPDPRALLRHFGWDTAKPLTP